MKIGLDVRWLHRAMTHSRNTQMLGGIGTYSYELISHLLDMDPDNEYILLIDATRPVGPVQEFIAEHYNARIMPLLSAWSPPSAKATIGLLLLIVHERRYVIPQLEKLELDLFHSLHQGVPPYPLSSSTSLVTVHNLIPCMFPERFFRHDLSRWLYKQRVRALAQGAAVIASSENTKRDLIRYAGAASDKIRVIHYGLSEKFRVIDDQRWTKSILAECGVKQPYILFVGNPAPNKNISRLLQAFALIRGDEYIPSGLSLVIVGTFQFHRDQLAEFNWQLRTLDLERHVIVTGYVPKHQLVALYNAALLLVHPALYEGFGFTPLEAMACGTPVIVSKVSSIPEVVGDAGVYVDPYNVEEMATAIRQVLADAELRPSLVAKGLARVRHFTWEKTAGQTLALYHELNRRARVE